MSTEVLTNLDLNQNAVQEFALESLATAPLTPSVGRQYFDATLGFARTWTGTAWLQGDVTNILPSSATAPVTPAVGQQYFDTTLGIPRTWNGTAWLSGAPAVGAVSKFATTVGDGLALTYTVTHNLNTRDVVVGLYTNTGGAEVLATVVHATVNTVTVTFAIPPLLNQYRVVVIG